MSSRALSRQADALDRVVHDFDRLIADCRNGNYRGSHEQMLHAAEEQGQRVAAAILAVFRGPAARPVNPPLHVSADGRSGVW